VVYTFTGSGSFDLFGIAVANGGDVNADGYPDLIISAKLNDDGGADAGTVYIFSGQDGSLIRKITGQNVGDEIGSSVSTAGDADNDGYDDVLIGAPLVNRAYVYSGNTGDLLYTFSGFGMFGESVASAGDVTGDGFNELIVGSSRAVKTGSSSLLVGKAHLYSGKTGNQLHAFEGEADGDWFGFSVASAGDVDNDGYSDLIIGARLADSGGTNTGSAYVYSVRPCFCADVNGDFLVNFEDVAFLKLYYFECKSVPVPLLSSITDLNCDGSIDVGDISHLAQYVNGTGPPPCCEQ
jgi:hypothetical protein